MKTIIIIPARYASSRFPGKPLAMLGLADGTRKSLIELSWQAAKQVNGISEVYVATDDDRIRDAAKEFGADVIMTSPSCANGTERCAEAIEHTDIDADLVINFQGDAPLTPPWFVEALIKAMSTYQSAQMATPVLQVDQSTYELFTEDRRHGRVGGTTAIFDRSSNALYFSKEVLPFLQLEKLANKSDIPVYHHVGVYAYRPEALKAYMHWHEGRLEKLEGLEQLRFLENGAQVKCVEVDARGKVFWELNNPEDIARIEKVLEA